MHKQPSESPDWRLCPTATHWLPPTVQRYGLFWLFNSAIPAKRWEADGMGMRDSGLELSAEGRKNLVSNPAFLPDWSEAPKWATHLLRHRDQPHNYLWTNGTGKQSRACTVKGHTLIDMIPEWWVVVQAYRTEIQWDQCPEATHAWDDGHGGRFYTVSPCGSIVHLLKWGVWEQVDKSDLSDLVPRPSEVPAAPQSIGPVPDWSEAPQGATHYQPDSEDFTARWFKLDSNGWHTWQAADGKYCPAAVIDVVRRVAQGFVARPALSWANAPADATHMVTAPAVSSWLKLQHGRWYIQTELNTNWSEIDGIANLRGDLSERPADAIQWELAPEVATHYVVSMAPRIPSGFYQASGAKMFHLGKDPEYVFRLDDKHLNITTHVREDQGPDWTKAPPSANFYAPSLEHEGFYYPARWVKLNRDETRYVQWSNGDWSYMQLEPVRHPMLITRPAPLQIEWRLAPAGTTHAKLWTGEGNSSAGEDWFKLDDVGAWWKAYWENDWYWRPYEMSASVYAGISPRPAGDPVKAAAVDPASQRGLLLELIDAYQCEADPAHYRHDLVDSAKRLASNLPGAWDSNGIPPPGTKCIVTPHNTQWGFAQVGDYECIVLGSHADYVWLQMLTSEPNTIGNEYRTVRYDKVDFSVFLTPKQKAAAKRARAVMPFLEMIMQDYGADVHAEATKILADFEEREAAKGE